MVDARWGCLRLLSDILCRQVLGGTVVGDGEGTVLVWAGKKGGNSTMILSDGISRSRLMGFVLDGTAGCDVGIEHHSCVPPSAAAKNLI